MADEEEATENALHRDSLTLSKPTVKRLFRGALIRIKDGEEDVSITQEKESVAPSKSLLETATAELQSPVLYKAATIELYGSFVLTFMSSCSVRTAVNSGLAFPPVSIAIFNGALLTLLIYATAAPSGGHINPLITLATAMVGLTSPVRALLYVPAQLVGSVLGSLLFRSGLGLWGTSVSALEMAGCVIPDSMSLSQAFCVEFATSFFVFVVAFGCAIDPVVGKLYGPIYAPLLIGVAIGMLIFATAALVPGYTGAGVNPARCFGPTVVANDGWKAYWAVFWTAPIVAALAHAPIYLLVPPDHVQRSNGHAPPLQIEENRGGVT